MSRPPEIDDYEKQHPLVRFSFYANGRVQVLLGLRVEILRELDKAFENESTLSF